MILKILKKKIFKKINFDRDFIWGAAGKGVVLTNLLELDYKKYKYLVDINKGIQNKFIPGSGVKIISPSILKRYLQKESKIFATNELYIKEIQNILYKKKVYNKVYKIF